MEGGLRAQVSMCAVRCFSGFNRLRLGLGDVDGDWREVGVTRGESGIAELGTTYNYSVDLVYYVLGTQRSEF